MYAHPGGPAALASWCNVWTQHSIEAWIARLWGDTLARPFYKNERQEGLRPVLQGECLYKFAVGVCLTASKIQVGEAVGRRQYGCGKRGGAELEVAEVRAAAAIYPERAMVGLDFRNAFGLVEWCDALQAMLATAPRLAATVGILWATFELSVWIADADGLGWHAFTTHGSIVQGNLEGQPAFCIVLEVIMEWVASDPRLSCARLRYWAYADDWTLQCLVKHVSILIAVIKEYSANLKFDLQVTKCAFHVPECKGLGLDDLPEEAREAATVIKYSPDGLTLLGTEACGDLATPLHTTQTVPEPTMQRVRRAQRLGRALCAMVRLAPAAGAKQPAWLMARGQLANALSYDVRVLPCSLVEQCAYIVDEAVIAVVEVVAECRWEQLTDSQRQQLHLPVWA